MENIVIYKGNDSAFSQTQKIIQIETNITDFNGWHGVLNIGNTGYSQEVTSAELTDKRIALRYTKNDTAFWPTGFHEIILTLTDASGSVKQILCDAIFEVRGGRND